MNSYPKGKNFKVAFAKFDSAFWSETLQSKNFDDYQIYLDKNPQGTHINEAKKILQKLNSLPILSKGWKIKNKELIKFNNHKVFLIISSYREITDDDTYQIKINNHYNSYKVSIYKCDENRINSNHNIWTLEAETKNESTFRPNIYFLKAKNSALIFYTEFFGYYQIAIDSHGKVKIHDKIHEELTNGIMSITDKSITFNENLKKTQYIIEDDTIKTKLTQKSDMAPENAVKLHFSINRKNNTSTDNESIEINVGQTVAFVPEDEKTRKLFNSGALTIYSDAEVGVGSTLVTEVNTGNYFKFEKEGVVHFSIEKNIMSNNVEVASFSKTFTVTAKEIQHPSKVVAVQNSTQSNTQSTQRGGYQRSNRDYFTCTSAVHEFLSRHSFKSDDGSRLSYSVGDLTISYNGGRLRFTNIEIRIASQDVAILSAMDVGSGRTLRIRINAAYGEIVDVNDRSTSFQAVN